MRTSVRCLTLALLLATLSRASTEAQAPRLPPPPAPAVNVEFPQLSEADAREWLTYLSSDALQGRQVFTEGYGLAASYIADHLRDWKLQPLGDNGTYLEGVRQTGYKVARHSKITIATTDGRSQTFEQGNHVDFSMLSGANQRLAFDDLVVVGPADGEGHEGDLSVVRGRLVLALPASTAAVRNRRADELVNFFGAAAVLTVAPIPLDKTPAGGARDRDGADLLTVRNVDIRRAPHVTVDASVADQLLGTEEGSRDLLDKARRGEAFAPVTIPNRPVRLTLDTTYTVTSVRRTENVVGLVPGTDPALRDTYVLFGAHLDHIGYRTSPPVDGIDCRPAPADDLVFNGADDDGSGSTALLLMAKALMTGPRPRRSVVLIWHAGEEAGLLGSEYMADHPVVPLDRVQAELNIDMIGRNRDDNPAQANTVYVIGDDRISTDLHNLIVATNQHMASPLTLDYEYNDPDDPNSFYTRSDHYSYASKGIPIAFFFTGTHPDYHCVTDEVGRILFPKLVRVAQMVYETGFSLADSTRTLVRDDRGPRAGRGFRGPLPR